VYVALYGESFIMSGRKATTLFRYIYFGRERIYCDFQMCFSYICFFGDRTRGWEAIVNDDLIDNVLGIGFLKITIKSILLSLIYLLSLSISGVLLVGFLSGASGLLLGTSMNLSHGSFLSYLSF